MAKIINYTILWGQSEALEKEVNEFISRGWQPLGGVAIDPPGEFTAELLYQAMVEYED